MTMRTTHAVAREDRRAERKRRREEKKARRAEVRELKRHLREERRAERARVKDLRRAERATGIKTLGGVQFWSDLVVVDDFRLQQHALVGHWRVLNPRNRRLHTGLLHERAEAVLREAMGTSMTSGRHLVLLLHGYGGWARRMQALRDALRARKYVAEIVEYPSFLRSIDEVASTLAELVRRSTALSGRRIERVSIVAFSMGGLVAKELAVKLSRSEGLPELTRLVSIGTPHLGSPLAELPAWLSFLGGPNVTALRTQPVPAPVELPVPLGTIGARGVRNGWTLLGRLGDGDGVVEIDSSVIDGAADQYVVEGIRHKNLPRDPGVIRAVLRYLKHGRFRAVQASTGATAVRPPGEETSRRET